MSAKKFVVVGGSGFLGSYIVEHLVNRGETNVTVFDIKKGSDMKNVKYIIGDITNLSDLENAFKGVDTGNSPNLCI
jgi:sterol-4alpha-carboxylate 3-dehydrogenase (decarboxylating)